MPGYSLAGYSLVAQINALCVLGLRGVYFGSSMVASPTFIAVVSLRGSCMLAWCARPCQGARAHTVPAMADPLVGPRSGAGLEDLVLCCPSMCFRNDPPLPQLAVFLHLLEKEELACGCRGLGVPVVVQQKRRTRCAGRRSTSAHDGFGVKLSCNESCAWCARRCFTFAQLRASFPWSASMCDELSGTIRRFWLLRASMSSCRCLAPLGLSRHNKK